MLSGIIDTFTIAITGISLYPVQESSQLALWVDSDYLGQFVQNGVYWKLIAYATAAGGCLVSVGSISGIALMKMEHLHLGWYLKNISLKMLLGWVIGFAVLFLETII